MNKSWIILALLWSFPAAALGVEETLPEPLQEARAQGLFREVRCVVCESETIADSPADVAADMRREIRRQVVAGKTDADIMAYLVSRYGDVVLLQPPFKLATALLWIGPLLVLALGVMLAWKCFRSRA